MSAKNFEQLAEDLTEGLSGRFAAGLARRAVQAVDWPEFKWNGPTDGGALETLIVFAYAKGVFSSSEIELACRTLGEFEVCSGKTYPAAEEIRQFRRAFKPWVEAALAELCFLLLASSVSGYCEIVLRRKAGSEAARRVLEAIRLDTACFEV